MKIKKIDWYHLGDKELGEYLELNVRFINYFCINNQNNPSAVYENINSNPKYKKYLAFTELGDRVVLQQLNKEEIDKYRYQSAIWCKECNTVLYSVSRRHFNVCSCDNQTSIDGGRLYLKYRAKDMNKIQIVTIDLLNDNIIMNGEDDVS